MYAFTYSRLYTKQTGDEIDHADASEVVRRSIEDQFSVGDGKINCSKMAFR